VATVDAKSGLVTGIAAGTAASQASGGGATQSVTVTVTLPPPPRPTIALSRTAVALASSVTAIALILPRDSVVVTNGGGGALTGLAVASVDFKGTVAWLDVALRSSTAPTVLAVGVNALGLRLPSGTYTAVVTIASPVAANSPVTVTVTYKR
jgi:hypothetical protein